MTKPTGRQSQTPKPYGERVYRRHIHCNHLVGFRVVCQETDLMILADRLLAEKAYEWVIQYRGFVEGFIRQFPDFATTLIPWQEVPLAPAIVREMIRAGSAAGVGPMAAIAGAMAESVGRALLGTSRQVVVENGGDLFVKTDDPVVARLFAGPSSLSMKLGIRVAETGDGIGICTSSGTVGHSLSAGKADAVCAISKSSALADAAATAIGNRIHSAKDIGAAIDFGRKIDDVDGIVVATAGEIGAWGQVELVPVEGKKG